MKYYCKSCGSVFEPGPGVITKSLKYPLAWDGKCVVCAGGKLMEKIPGHETPAQYKARTGKPYPDDGLVFFRHVFDDEVGKWNTSTYLKAATYWATEGEDDIVIADPPAAPADDWRPE